MILNHMALAASSGWSAEDARASSCGTWAGEEHAIAFEAYSLGLSEVRRMRHGCHPLLYSSMTTPSQLFDYNMATRERTLLKTRVPSATIRTTM